MIPRVISHRRHRYSVFNTAGRLLSCWLLLAPESLSEVNLCRFTFGLFAECEPAEPTVDASNNVDVPGATSIPTTSDARSRTTSSLCSHSEQRGLTTFGLNEDACTLGLHARAPASMTLLEQRAALESITHVRRNSRLLPNPPWTPPQPGHLTIRVYGLLHSFGTPCHERNCHFSGLDGARSAKIYFSSSALPLIAPA